MKKTILTLILLGFIILAFTGCSKKEDKIKQDIPENDNKELIACLENELGAYLVTESDTLVDIPLSDIKNSDQKIEYYKGVYASRHPKNRYVIISPKDGLYEADEMKYFDKYFYQKYPIYQRKDVTNGGITIYIHNENNDVDLDSIVKTCTKKSDSIEGKSLPSKTIDKINDTKEIIIKSNNKDLGKITDSKKINELLEAISTSKQYGDAFLCDGNAFDFEMYDKNGKFIDTIHVWGDGSRLIPKSISEGCSYYVITNDFDIRKFIEDETHFVFYGLSDFSTSCNKVEEVIYEDADYKYYLDCQKSDEFLIHFGLTNQMMTLKYALTNKLINAETVHNDYPELLLRKDK